MLFVDPTQSADAFDRDWVAVHELSHMFHPYLDDRGSWLAEGLATYYQNVLRARAGLLTPAQAWEQIDAGFARGRGAMPARQRRRSERIAGASTSSPNFMRIYWSGTAYWLEVDTELGARAATSSASTKRCAASTRAACRTIAAWEPDDFVAKLDALIGTDVFRKHFDAYRARRDFPDLDSALSRNSASAATATRLTFDDTAPAADVRRAITGRSPLRVPSR